MSFINNLLGFCSKIATKVYPHLPTIGVAVGSASVLGGAFLACKATLNVDRVIEEHNAMMMHIEESVAKLPDGSLTDMEIRHDKAQTYLVTAGKLTRLYAPAIGLFAAGFASIFAGFGMIKHWHALAISSVAAIDEKFASYRGRVIDNYGEEVDLKLLKGDTIKTTTTNVTTIDEDGNEKTEKVRAFTSDTDEPNDVIKLRDAIEDDFTRIFDYRNKYWENDFLMNDRFLEEKQLWYSKMLGCRRMDHAFMNVILKELGYKETGIGHFYGWTSEPGCCDVRFNIQPFMTIWDTDDDGQFPLMIPFPVAYDEEEGGKMFFINKEDEDTFRQAYIDDPESIGFILRFNVNTDENGVPKNIYNEVYGK